MTSVITGTKQWPGTDRTVSMIDTTANTVIGNPIFAGNSPIQVAVSRPRESSTVGHWWRTVGTPTLEAVGDPGRW